MQKVRTNQQIRVPTVRVISEDGKQIGVMETSKAFALAQEHGLDLVEVSPLANPPVVKLIDFDKFRYQQKKAEAKQKKKAKKTEVKTMWISMRIGEHDMRIKAGKVAEFLKEGDLVRVELRMKGREQAYPDLARKQLENFLKMVEVPSRIEVPIKKMGPTFSITVAPSK